MIKYRKSNPRILKTWDFYENFSYTVITDQQCKNHFSDRIANERAWRVTFAWLFLLWYGGPLKISLKAESLRTLKFFYSWKNTYFKAMLLSPYVILGLITRFFQVLRRPKLENCILINFEIRVDRADETSCGQIRFLDTLK